MRIALVNLEHQSFVGGRQSYVTSMMEALANKVDSLVAVSAQPSDLPSEPVASSRNLEEIHLPIRDCRSTNEFFEIFIATARPVLEELHARRPFDIVHAHGVVDLQAAAGLKIGSGVPLVLTIHSPPPKEETRWLTDAKDLADSVVVLSQYMREWLLGEGYAKERVRIIPGLVDFRLFKQDVHVEDLADRLEIDTDETILFCPARLSHRKGIHVLLRAVPLVIERMKDRQVRVLLAGRGSAKEHLLLQRSASVSQYLTDLATLIDELDLWHYLVKGRLALESRFALAEMPALYKLSSIAVCPTLSVPFGEPFGLVLLEAMRMGTPVVATTSGGMPEIVKHGFSAMLCPPDDHVTLAEQICELLNNEELRRHLATTARTEVEKYNSDVIVGMHLELYEELLGPEAGQSVSPTSDT